MKTKTKLQQIGIVSLGCAKNLVDSEVLMRQLDANKFEVITDPSGSNPPQTIIINTCGFISDAKKESIDTIMQFVDAKNKGITEKVYVMGCLSERYKAQIEADIPEVDGVFGVNELKKIIQKLGGDYKRELAGERFLTTPSHFAYLKIAEGCDRKCSFCAIPLIRGKHVSRPIDEIVQEAKTLVAGGVKEIILISQDTTYYGLDLYKQRKLADLLRSVSDIQGLEWLRLHYTYPDGFPMEVLDVIKERANICNYIDIPLQHFSSRILKSMKRGVDKEQTLDLIGEIRSKIPDIAIRTTLITGYPGETKKEFNELLDVIKEVKFERLGVFSYSHEEDTGAFLLKDNVPARVKQERVEEIMAIQEGISSQLNHQKIGKSFKTLIDRKENDHFIGRTEYDSPEIDNEVLILDDGLKVIPGNFYTVNIESADSFDLYGKIQEKRGDHSS